MTIIVGVEHRLGVWMGADSACTATSGEDKDEDRQSKLVRRHGWLLGFAGSWAVLPLLRNLKVRAPQGNNEDGALIADALREAVQGVKLNRSSFVVLAGGRGRLWYIQGSDWGVMRSSRRYNAIGTGAEYALGSLHTTQRRHTPELRVRKALLAAEALCMSCGGRHRVMQVR